MSFAVVAGVAAYGLGASAVGAAAIGAGAYALGSGGGDSGSANLDSTATDSVQLGRDQFNWFKNEYAKTQPQRDAATETSTKASQAQTAGMEFATQQAKDLAERNKTVFQPLEDRIVSDAAGYDTAGRRLEANNEAAAGVEQAFGSATDGLNRSLARSGVTPNSGRSMSLMQDMALKKATATAGATSTAVKNIEQQGYARKMDAVGLGKGIVGSQATQQQIAQSGGAQAVAASNAALTSATSGAGLMKTGFDGAMTGLGQAGNLYGQSSKINQQQDAATMQGVGQLAGMAAMYMSDKTKKSGTGKKASTKKALKGIVATPVKAGWKYDPAKGGPDDGGQPHDGPMAQDVRKHMGNKVAPGGKAIDVASMNGQLMAGMQELAKKVSKLEKKVAA